VKEFQDLVISLMCIELLNKILNLAKLGLCLAMVSPDWPSVALGVFNGLQKFLKFKKFSYLPTLLALSLLSSSMDPMMPYKSVLERHKEQIP
jgi:hypothetical protein